VITFFPFCPELSKLPYITKIPLIYQIYHYCINNPAFITDMSSLHSSIGA